MSAGELRLVERPVPRLGQRREHPVVVVAEIARVVLLARQRQAERLEHLLIRAQVQRLGVGEDAVEVEDDRRDHLSRPSCSPARTGIGSRFSRGGTGQSYSG